MKAIVIKNPTNRIICEYILPIPSVIVIRWCSWLESAMLNFKNLHSIKSLILGIKNDRVLFNKALKSCYENGLYEELIEIKVSFLDIIGYVDDIEQSKFKIKTSIDFICKLNFKKDPTNIKTYIMSRLDKSDFYKNVNIGNKKFPQKHFSFCKIASLLQYLWRDLFQF
ncbi:hypothetical protein DMUE_3407 [Dictyocoela muelleri]|nr:hypothetical protein DMUE_3407 [Dictyocoela muelleri]